MPLSANQRTEVVRASTTEVHLVTEGLDRGLARPRLPSEDPSPCEWRSMLSPSLIQELHGKSLRSSRVSRGRLRGTRDHGPHDKCVFLYTFLPLKCTNIHILLWTHCKFYLKTVKYKTIGSNC